MSKILNLYKRSDSRFYWFKWEFEGRAHRGSTKSTNKADAKAYAELHVQQIRDSLLRKEIPDIPWEVAVGRWLEKNQQKKSAKDDRQRLTRLGEEYFAGRLISEIDEDSVDAVLEKMRARRAGGKVESGPISPATKNRYLAVLRSVLIQCKAWNWLEDVPLLPKNFKEHARTRYLSDSQADALMKALPLHFGKMAEISLQTGLRYSNVAKMRWDWIDFSRNEVRVQGEFTKNGKDLIVPLNSSALTVLKWAAEYRPGGVKSIMNGGSSQVFWRQDHSGEWFEVAALHSETWARSLARAKLDRNWRWHDLRHTWASRHVLKGTHPKVLKELGGWDTLEMVDRYSHPPKELSSIVEAICSKPALKRESLEDKVENGKAPAWPAMWQGPSYSVSYSVDHASSIELAPTGMVGVNIRSRSPLSDRNVV